MDNRKFGPYRATGLWNEAVILFRDGMMLSEHRHRLHKHKNSFTGRHAVTFMLGALKSSNLFNADITRVQVCQLLNQFLNANLVQTASNCSVATQKTFVDSYKYFYEFTEELEHFQPKLPFQYTDSSRHAILGENIPDLNCSSGNIYHSSCCRPKTVEELWKDAIIKRIIELLNPLEIENLIPVAEINAKWVFANASPNYLHLRSNTELPHWVLGAINKLLQWSSQDTCTVTYKNFEVDVFNVIHEYFNTLDSSLILAQFYPLYTYIFLYIDYLNSFEIIVPKRTNTLSKSTENLVLNILSPAKCQDYQYNSSGELVKNNGINRQYLSPDSCLETVFASNVPITRIVPKCSADTTAAHVHTSGINNNFHLNPTLMSNTCKENRDEIYNLKAKNQKNVLKSIGNIHYSDFKKGCSKNNSCGVINEAFAFPITLEKQVSLTNHGSPPKLRKVCCDKKKKVKLHKSSKTMNHNFLGIINPCLSSSSESIDTTDNIQRIDYLSAYESLKKLMLVSLQDRRYFCSSDDEISAYYTAGSSSSSCDLSSTSDNSSSNGDFTSGSNNLCSWSRNLLQLGVSVFQLLLTMLPPCNRARLRYLILLMRSLPEASSSPYLSLNNLVIKMSRIIMRPAKGIYFDELLVRRITTFLIVHYNFIFDHLQPDLLESLKQYVVEQQSKSTKSFCEQISAEQFEKQKICESEAALHELLDQILDDKKMRSKEKKKKLKMFEEAYPNIYKQHFFRIKGNKSVSLHSLTKLPAVIPY